MKTEEIKSRLRAVIADLPEYENDAHYGRIDDVVEHVSDVLYDALEAQAREIERLREALEEIARLGCEDWPGGRVLTCSCNSCIAQRALVSEPDPVSREPARAICEHLGVTWEDVNALDAFLKSGLVWEAHPKSGPAPYLKVRNAIATFLEAAGIPRDGDAP